MPRSRKRDSKRESADRDETRSKTPDRESGTGTSDRRVERLHSSAGNQAVQRAVEDAGAGLRAGPASVRSGSAAGGASTRAASDGNPGGIPMGSPDSSYEREADAVAKGVLEGGLSPPRPSRLSASRVQRETGDGGDDRSHAPPSVAETVSSSGQPLDREVRSSMESTLGEDFGSVRVHTGPQAARSASEIGARAYAVGNDVAFDSGEYAPETPGGREVLAHELTHVAQQDGGDLAVQAMEGGGSAAAREVPSQEEAAEAMSYADLAQDVYGDDGAPEGWERVENFENSESGFFAALYRNPATDETVLAFRGSNPLELADWTEANLPNALNQPSKQYRRAIELANDVASEYENVTFTGHSLGGGLASAASMATGREAVTFNAAGPAPEQMLELDTTDLLTADPEEDVTAYVVRGDVVNWAQDLVGGQVADHPLGHVTGGTWKVLSSPAQGTRKELPQPSDMIENSWNPLEWGSKILGVKQHGMETVKKALAELQGAGQ
ncbi:hypothetical protein BRD00_10920 [Halobacteriales archaeon QS_8_69_26]|nr:MAG: hypothetical protein BRD00_10920 [Halobacteriales archaeon QS_8_69_26]